MNKILEKLSEGASDAGALARSITDSGLRSVSEIFRGTKLFGALTASSADHLEQDETHYVLVPLLGSPDKHAIYTKRILPPDTGATNSLPKARLFHLPDETGGKELLERELISKMVSDRLEHDAGSSDFADALEKLADQIDSETNKISGGLVLIGGAVAFVNPLLGVGIAAKALLPSIGAKASKTGAEYVGNKLRDWNLSSAVSKLEKDATKEVRKLKPRIFANPILRSLEAIATHPETDHDPALDHRNWIDAFEPRHHYAVTEEAIREVYREALSTMDLRCYRELHLDWIRSFVDGPRPERPG